LEAVLSLTPNEAADALRDIATTGRRSGQAFGYRISGPFLIIWGIAWMVGYGVTDLMPRWANIVWPASIAIFTIVSFVVARANRQGNRGNAFRVLGLPLKASDREIARRVQEIELSLKFGGSINADIDALALDPPPSIDQIREASQRLKDPATRFLDEFFVILADQLYMSAGEPQEDQALALRPAAGHLYTSKIRNLLYFAGDTVAAQQVLAKIPATYLLDDQGAYTASLVWLWSRQPDKCLEALRGLTHDYLDSRYYIGPKTFLTGLAHQMAGRHEAATADWRIALQKIEERLVVEPGSVRWLRCKASHMSMLSTQTASVSPRGKHWLRITGVPTFAKRMPSQIRGFALPPSTCPT